MTSQSWIAEDMLDTKEDMENAVKDDSSGDSRDGE